MFSFLYWMIFRTCKRPILDRGKCCHSYFFHQCAFQFTLENNIGGVDCNTRRPLLWTYKERSFHHSRMRWLMGSMFISLHLICLVPIIVSELLQSNVYGNSDICIIPVYPGIWTKWCCWICSESVEGSFSFNIGKSKI